MVEFNAIEIAVSIESIIFYVEFLYILLETKFSDKSYATFQINL